VNPGFCEKMEVTRVPPGISSRTTSGTRTTGWESLFYDVGSTHSLYIAGAPKYFLERPYKKQF